MAIALRSLGDEIRRATLVVSRPVRIRPRIHQPDSNEPLVGSPIHVASITAHSQSHAQSATASARVIRRPLPRPSMDSTFIALPSTSRSR